MAEKVTSNVVIKNARLIFKNFKGEGSDFNAPGNRNFGVVLDDELAEKLKSDGWNVKHLKPREDDPEGYRTPWLKVNVKFGKIPPIINLINSVGKIRLDEDSVDQLDWTRMENVDLIIRPYNYPALAGRPAGVSAYLKSLYVTVDEDELERKYANVPDIQDSRSNALQEVL